ncbi:anti-lipopolysaccharide factor [Penaeus vannamei]|uniref:anti-lipopolysaccharide factor n=1 Tax=Penaeus vannamei TaxID=6689 RepID=UPI000F65CEAF|nr:anti-lipopolysaccharide factor-like [Penaeus vannamei]
MKLVVFISLVGLVLTENVNTKEKLLTYIAQELTWHGRNGSVTFLHNKCEFSVTPKSKDWMPYHESNFSCPDWTNIVGEATGRCRVLTAAKAAKDFVVRALDIGLFNFYDGKAWLFSEIATDTNNIMLSL